MGAMESTRGSMSCESWVFAAEISTVSGTPRRSHSTWIFEPGLPRSTGFGPVRSPPFFGSDADRVDDRSGPVDLADHPEFVQELLM